MTNLSKGLFLYDDEMIDFSRRPKRRKKKSARYGICTIRLHFFLRWNQTNLVLYRSLREKSTLSVHQLIFIDGSVSTIKSNEHEDEDFIFKMIGTEMFYRDFSNRKESLKYLVSQNLNLNYTKLYLKAKHNQIFSNFILSDLDDKAKEAKGLNNQFAFVLFKRKDGSLAESRRIYYPSGSDKHSEDEIFKLLLNIYENESCDVSVIYIYSFNSPCLARRNCVPCMIRAFFIANLLNVKHGIKTVIGFSKSWGINGSFKNVLPSIPHKDLISTSGTQISISEVQNQTFLLKDCKKQKPKIKLQPFFSKIRNFENRKIREKINKIVKNLSHSFTQKSDSHRDGFHEYGLKILEKCTEEISDLLKDDTEISKEICSYLKTDVLPFWDERVEESFREMIEERVDEHLRLISLHRSILDFKHFEKHQGRDFFEIGYVVEEESLSSSSVFHSSVFEKR